MLAVVTDDVGPPFLPEARKSGFPSDANKSILDGLRCEAFLAEALSATIGLWSEFKMYGEPFSKRFARL